MSDIHITRHLSIPQSELVLTFSTSGGPGGQHANKVATRAELAFDVMGSRSLTERQRDRIMRKLRHRIDSHGVLRLSSDKHRSQLRNRQEVMTRLVHLLQSALRVERQRVATTPTASAREARLRSKHAHSQTKRLRRRPQVDD
ncbi:MAG: aminoacyl-tRNA hydrolase [Actinomycetota bacterium]|nr:aminoacyl-tRNA hydrolase [Actinomycetota bacterium]